MISKRTTSGSEPGDERGIPLDRLIGRQVVDRDGRAVGRIEELRVNRSGTDWTITGYVIGVGGLLERLGVGAKLILGFDISAQLASAAQMDLSDFRHPKLRCSREDLRRA